MQSFRIAPLTVGPRPDLDQMLGGYCIETGQADIDLTTVDVFARRFYALDITELIHLSSF